MRPSATLIVILLAGVLSWPAAAADPVFPALSGRVIDQAGVLSPAAEARLSEVLQQHELATSNQVVVATIGSLQGLEVADYANRLFRHWRLGQAGRDNGVLLLVAPTERKVRIEVGYGLEGVLTDALSTDIIHNRLLPAFRDGKFAAGIEAGVAGILAALEGTYGPLPAAAPPAWLPFLMFGVAMVAMLLLRHYGRRMRGRGSPWQPGHYDRRDRWRRGGFPGGTFGGGYGGASGGSGSGGGMSGGGGSSGGGGASGSW